MKYGRGLLGQKTISDLPWANLCVYEVLATIGNDGGYLEDFSVLEKQLHFL